MPVETPSIFAQVIKEHLDLKERNARLGGSMPIERYKGRGSVREPSAVQERAAGANRGDDGRCRSGLQRREPRGRHRWPGEEPLEEVTAETSEATAPAIEESAFWGNGGARDFDWGD